VSGAGVIIYLRRCDFERVFVGTASAPARAVGPPARRSIFG
jgi:hypothetical protein